jgi:hypothetical protein
MVGPPLLRMILTYDRRLSPDSTRTTHGLGQLGAQVPHGRGEVGAPAQLGRQLTLRAAQRVA